MPYKLKAKGVQFAELPEDYTPKGKIHAVHEPPIREDGRLFKQAVGLYDEDEQRIGYIPEDCEIKLTAYEASVLDCNLEGKMTKGFWHEEEEDTWNSDGEGVLKGIRCSLDWPDRTDVEIVKGCYKKEETKYNRITSVLKGVEWEKGRSEGLLAWALYKFNTPEEQQQYLNMCGLDGSLLHLKAEMLIKGETLPKEVRFPERVLHFLDALRPELISTETVVFDEALKIAGTFDALAIINGKKTIIDWKRSKKSSEQYLYQMAFYAKNIGAEQAIVVPFGAPVFKPNDLPIMGIDEINKRYTTLTHMVEMFNSMET